MNPDSSPGQAQDIAVVGAACRLPGGIVNLDGLTRFPHLRLGLGQAEPSTPAPVTGSVEARLPAQATHDKPTDSLPPNLTPAEATH